MYYVTIHRIQSGCIQTPWHYIDMEHRLYKTVSGKNTQIPFHNQFQNERLYFKLQV